MSDRKISWTLRLILPVLSTIGVILPVANALAQGVVADDRAATTVEVTGDRFDITGGQLSGDRANLFQSFEQFTLGSQQTANFITTADVQNVIGRVNGGSASIIDGTLQVSGSHANLYLMNPAGVLIGPNAQLNLTGGFTATTATGIGFEHGRFSAAGASDYSNLSGDPKVFYFEHAQTGAVVNTADLSVAEGQAITLVGGMVVNAGRLSAPAGTVTLAAIEGENLVRISQGDQLLSLEVEAIDPTLASAILPQSIGEMLTGGNLSNATALVTAADGTVQLGSTTVDEKTGSAIASGHLSVTGEVGGNINVLGDRIHITDATIEASGNTSGGLIRIGGDYKGNGPVANAAHTTVNHTSTLAANALENGDGGKIIVWADDMTQFYGEASASGGSEGGNGGFVEVSGKTRLVFAGRADVSALQGNFGNILLDPQNWVVTDGAAPSPGPDNTSYISRETLTGMVGTVELAAENNITIQDLAGDKLAFQPGTTVIFKADSDNNQVGAFTMADNNDAITSENGAITIFGAGVTAGSINTDTAAGTNSGDITIVSSQGVVANSVSTNSYSANNNAGTGGNVSIEANGGDIAINNLIKTWSYAANNNARRGGSITLAARDNITTGLLSTVSQADQNNAGAGGAVSLTARIGNITVGGIESFSRAGNNNAESGGNVNLEALSGEAIVGYINTSSSAGNNNAGDGGAVVVAADIIDINSINSRSSSEGVAGAVSLLAGSRLTAGSITATGKTEIANGNIHLRGNEIDLEGGDSSIRGGSVQLLSASDSQAINLGVGNGVADNPLALDISEADIKAIEDSGVMIGSDSHTGGMVSQGDVVFSNSVLLRSQGNIDTTRGQFLSTDGDITLQTNSEITAASIRTLNGGVTLSNLSSAGNIQVEFIEANSTGKASAFIEVDTQGAFVATGTSPATSASVSTGGIKDGGITIHYGSRDRPAEVFLIGQPSSQGTASRLATSVAEITAGELASSFSEDNIHLINRGFSVPQQPLEPPAVATLNIQRPGLVNAVDNLPEPARFVYATTDEDAEAIARIIKDIETGTSQEFIDYLGLTHSHEAIQTAPTIAQMRATLSSVAQATGAKPALVYVYFVPDAASEDAVVTSSERLARPDDQLEIMVITQAGEPVRYRRWGITREQVEKTSHNLRQQVNSQFSDAQQYLPPAQQLYDWIVRPIVQDLVQRDIDSLGFVVETGLRTLPLATLHDGEQYLVENYSLGLLPTFTLTDFQIAGASHTDFKTSRVLAMGVSDFEDLPDLPAVSQEVSLITGQLWDGDAFLNENFISHGSLK
ncbi:MAG: filamentous hemagglutinin N-terminal domain-containing protein [Phormidesmis sp.]